MQEKVPFTIFFTLSANAFNRIFSYDLCLWFFPPDFLFREKEKYKYICDDMDSTFAELTGY